MTIKKKMEKLKQDILTHKKEVIIGSVTVASFITLAILCRKETTKPISAEELKDIMFPGGRKLTLSDDIQKLGITEIKDYDQWMEIWMDHGGIGPTLGELGDFGKRLMDEYNLREDFHIEGMVSLEKY